MLRRLIDQADREALRVTQHAQEEMTEEDIVLEDVLEALRSGAILENYPEHRRGACCLVCGYTRQRRPLHVVCTTAQPLLILITVYEPKPPKWVTPTRRGSKS
jgi:hypothetical protein